MPSPCRQIGFLLAGTMLAGIGAAAAAQQPGQDSGQTSAADMPQPADQGDIIVTAQKRSESLQNVPISIQALGTEELEQTNVSNFNDFTKQLPSVSFQTIQPGSTTVYIRGVASGGDGNHSGSLPSVGTYLDEQPITTIGGTLDVHIYDVARIEALSGPQGTLYGASSEAGTIRIITNKPDSTKFDAAIDAEVNSVHKGGQGGKVEGFANLPLSEAAAVRIVGFYQHDAGYIDNVPGSRRFLKGLDANGDPDPNGILIDNAARVKKDFNDVDTFGGRAALKIDLDDNWTATATVLGQDQKSNGVFGFDAKTGDLQVQHFLEDSNHDRFIQGALTIEGKIGNWDLTYAGAYLKRKVTSSGDYTDYAEAYDTLYAANGGLAGYFYYQDNAGNQIVPTQRIAGEDKFNKLSQELRISSPAESPFRVVGGLFYQRQFRRIHQDYKVEGLADALSVNGLPGTLWLTQQNRIDKDYAAFGEASYDILSNLTLTGGLRYYKFDNSLIGFFGFGRNPNGPPYNAAGSSRTGVAACYNTDGSTVRDNPGGTLIAAAVSGAPCTNLGVYDMDGTISPKRVKDDGFIHRLNLTWKVVPGKLVYATWSRGFRPGGINRRADIAAYDPDYLVNYEIGFKTSWLDRKLRINGALFWQDWKKFQFSFLGQNSFTEIHNGPDARIRGVEADVTLIPAEGLTLSATGAYIDARTRRKLCGFDDPTYQCMAPGPGGQDNYVSSPKGTRLPVTPKFKISGVARYEFPLGDAIDAHVQGVVTHQSSATSDVRRLIFLSGPGGGPIDPAVATGPLPAFTLFDFSAGVDFNAISLEAFVVNAFDKRAQITRFQECGACFQRPYTNIYRPRTISLRAGYKF